MKTHLLTVHSRGTFVLPADVRRRHHLDRPDAQIRLIEQDDGRSEIVPVDRSRGSGVVLERAWQAMEREAEADIAAGRTTTVEGLEGLLEHLDSIRRDR